MVMRKARFSRTNNTLIGWVALALCLLAPHPAEFTPGSTIAAVAAGASAPAAKGAPHACTEIGPASLSAAARSDLVWKGKTELRVSFIGGSSELRSRVRRHASTWNRYSGLPFAFVADGPAEIRVSFEQNGRSWSYIGNSAERVSPTKATMNFGWFDETTTEEELRRTTLHEFGHALGLVHEHQSPGAAIKWNKPAVYKYYESHFEWNENKVNDNIFKKYEVTRTQFGRYDPTSIMHYPIPVEFTTDGSSVGWNTSLSTTDKAFVRQLYPPSNTGR
jgi:serralysin